MHTMVSPLLLDDRRCADGQPDTVNDIRPCDSRFSEGVHVIRRTCDMSSLLFVVLLVDDTRVSVCVCSMGWIPNQCIFDYIGLMY